MILAPIIAVLVTINTAHSYILLTANLEDVQAIAKQLARSPVVDQLNKIWRRAASQFNQQIAKDRGGRAQMRAQDSEGGEEESDRDNRVVRRSQQPNDDLVALGRNASRYLNSIRKIFEKIPEPQKQ